MASFPVCIQNVELGHGAKAPPPLVKQLRRTACGEALPHTQQHCGAVSREGMKGQQVLLGLLASYTFRVPHFSTGSVYQPLPEGRGREAK